MVVLSTDLRNSGTEIMEEIVRIKHFFHIMDKKKGTVVNRTYKGTPFNALIILNICKQNIFERLQN